MEETRRKLTVIDGERRPRVAALAARVDAGEADALEALEKRIRGDYEDLVRSGRAQLADEVWTWALARVEDVERADEHAEQEEADDAPLPEAPVSWRGLRVCVSYIAGGGTSRPSEIAGRLEEANERGVRIAIDELEEEHDGDDPTSAGSIARRVRAERFLTWGSLLTVQPLPVSAVGEGA